MKKLIVFASILTIVLMLFVSTNADAGCNWNAQQERWVGNCGGGGNAIQGQAQGQIQGQAQGQIQGQAQGQDQNQSQSQSNDANNSNSNSQNVTVNNNAAEQKDITTTNINARGYRSFANAAEITYTPLPTYFGPANRDANVQPADAMVMFKDTFTRAEVESYLKGTGVKSDRKGEEITNDEKTADQTIQVILIAPAKSSVVQTALITTSAKNNKTESKDVLYAALLSGLDSGADLLLVTAEGAGTILKSFGWGIGLSYTRATLSSDESTGGVGAGGLGISGGEAGYKSLPWLQSIGLKLVK